MYKKIFYLCLLVCLTACSTGEESDEMASPNALDNQGFSAQIDGRYSGHWSINDKEIDGSADISVATPQQSPETPQLTLHDFPFEAVAKALFPDLGDFKTFSRIPQYHDLNDDGLLLLQTQTKHHSGLMECETAFGVSIVGYSNQAFYGQMATPTNQLVSFSNPNQAYRYLPFVVMPSGGESFAVVLYVAPTQSTFIFTGNGVVGHFIVNAVETTTLSGTTVLKQLPTAMKLTFTSTKKLSLSRV